ncbi:hypothetical protein [Streptomyces sp. NPDC086838]|uniref:hypothetical protein n=1 Tax=Streptomyces sp. NPDC086838 TaxID=3365762 RepID=UPI0037FD89CA
MPHATVTDLEAWLAPEPVPDTAARLLSQASRRVDRALHGAYYDITDPYVVDALREATVCQAHWMIDRDDETDATADLQSMSTGQRSFTRRTVGEGAGATPRLAPAALDVLMTSGLFRFDPLVVG